MDEGSRKGEDEGAKEEEEGAGLRPFNFLISSGPSGENFNLTTIDEGDRAIRRESAMRERGDVGITNDSERFDWRDIAFNMIEAFDP